MSPVAHTYNPSEGSPEARVLDLLHRNPEEDYTSADLALKFQVAAVKWGPLLAAPLAQGLVARSPPEGPGAAHARPAAVSLWQVQLQRPCGVVVEHAETRHHPTALRVMRTFIRRCWGRRDSLVLVHRDGREISYAQMRGDGYQGPPWGEVLAGGEPTAGAAVVKNARRRVNRARNFPANTCAASRHLHLMADQLARGKPYAMLAEEPQECAMTMLAVVEALWKTRTELARVNCRIEQRPTALTKHE